MRILESFFLILIFAVGLICQEKTQVIDNPEWIRIESQGRDFSFELPRSGYLVDNEDGAFRVFFASQNVSITVSMIEKSSAKVEFREFARFSTGTEKYKYFETSDFLIKQSSTDNEKKEVNYLGMFLASSKGSYDISATSKDATDVDFTRFLRSIQLSQKPLFSGGDRYPPEKQTILVSTMKSDAIVIDALRKSDSKQLKLEKRKEPFDDKKNDQTAYSRRVLILRKPKSQYTESARLRKVTGVVRLSVTFLASGEIGNITLVKSLDKDLDKSAFDAAKKIKFIPAEIDGKAVEVVKTFEYAFHIY